MSKIEAIAQTLLWETIEDGRNIRLLRITISSLRRRDEPIEQQLELNIGDYIQVSRENLSDWH